MLGLLSSTWSTGLTVMDDAVLALEAALRLVPIISPGAESAPTENFGEFAGSGFGGARSQLSSNTKPVQSWIGVEAQRLQSEAG